jgi:hypothetical protein
MNSQPILSRQCVHQAPTMLDLGVMVNPLVGGKGYLAQCLKCGTIGAVEETPEKALQELRAQQGSLA